VLCRKRIDGDLAVSRAFGDFEYKNRPDLEPALQKVSCRPDIRVEEAGPADDLLVLACDGLWDVMSSSEAVETVREILAAGEEDMRLVAEELVDLALNKGSRDNVSAVVLRLPAAVVGPLEGGGVHGRRKRREKDNEDAVVVKDKP
jgi:protein phosphatase 1B